MLVAGGVYASKPRPAVVLQEDFFDGTDSVTVCPMTTTELQAPLLRMPIPKDEISGVDTESFIMIDKITTIRRSSVDQVIGRLDSTQTRELERRVIVFLGLAR